MNFEGIKQQIENYQKDGKRIFTTSSFQSHSIVLLHILSRIDRSIPVYFLNTGYLFPETIQYRDQISAQLGLNTIDLHSLTPKSMQKGHDGKLFFTSDPDHCCYLNKIQPMENIMAANDIWINGVRADQSAARKAMKVEQNAPHGVVRFHPMLDWNSKMIYDYRKKYDLPDHPLDSQGYFSIGCEPCTRKMDLEMQEREARWYGMNKTECGLHTDLIKK
ncbi:phosphoadenylyl-sulfate reductase [Fulvivirgaceae bacterium BMA10]|uniref:Adenosine 5'-phosphosulfate reductase n=1 Tax=Splendidivirga corallicola TaxID=3051826 RepID=A0ABT8KSK7_9BACT|nr:phosphoadenylyl-sulfate reductase [Fulvivirgaceae bacterium BMA10]